MVRAVFDVDFDEALILAISYGAINVMHHHGECLDRDVSRVRIPDVHAYMGDFRVTIGAPRNEELGMTPFSEAERVIYGHQRRGPCDVRKLEIHAYITRRVDIGVRSAQMLVDRNSTFAIERNARLVESQPF